MKFILSISALVILAGVVAGGYVYWKNQNNIVSEHNSIVMPTNAENTPTTSQSNSADTITDSKSGLSVKIEEFGKGQVSSLDGDTYYQERIKISKAGKELSVFDPGNAWSGQIATTSFSVDPKGQFVYFWFHQTGEAGRYSYLIDPLTGKDVLKNNGLEITDYTPVWLSNGNVILVSRYAGNWGVNGIYLLVNKDASQIKTIYSSEYPKDYNYSFDNVSVSSNNSILYFDETTSASRVSHQYNLTTNTLIK